MIFLPGETTIGTPFDGVTLTNYRLRSEGKEALASIMLDQVSHVRATWHANPALLLVAFLAAGVGIGVGLLSPASASSSIGTSYIVVGSIVAAVFVIMYFASRYSLVTISSSGGAIHIRTNAKFVKCTEFLEILEAAKHARINVLFSL